MAWKHPKTSSSARGYGSAWQRLRAQVLGDEPLCRMCNRAGRLRLAHELDHIKPKCHGGTDERANLQPLCVECHTLKTARDKGHTLRARTGADGWPVG